MNRKLIVEHIELSTETTLNQTDLFIKFKIRPHRQVALSPLQSGLIEKFEWVVYDIEVYDINSGVFAHQFKSVAEHYIKTNYLERLSNLFQEEL